MLRNIDVSRRDLLKSAGAVSAAAVVLDGAPLVQTATSGDGQLRYGVIGTGSRGTYLLAHLRGISNGHCVALCDIRKEALDNAAREIGTNPRTYTDYHELLDRKDIDAVLVATPLFTHFPITRDVLLSGRHVFCEKCLVFKPEEIHALRALSAGRPKQILQTGLQRRYSCFYQTVKSMVDKGILGDVRYIHAQWHRNMINKPSSLWTMKPGGESNIANWRLYRSMSGGLTAELTSHQIDVSDWMFGASPELVMGFGSIDMLKDGRNVYDNVQLIYRYSGNRQFTYSSISTNQYLPYFSAGRAEFGEIIMGTEGTIEITVGGDSKTGGFQPPIAWWHREPPKTTKVTKADVKPAPVLAGATMSAGTGAGSPIPIMTGDIEFNGKENFLQREVKFARRWLTSKGVLLQEESRNPVDTELETFFQNCRDGKRPKADLELGLADSIAVMASNLAMDEGRPVYFQEIEAQAVGGPKPKGTSGNRTSAQRAGV